MRILIPIDGSELSLRAVEHAARVVGEGEVVLFHVTGIPPELLEHRGGSADEEERELEREVGERSRHFEEEIRPKIEQEVFRPAEEKLLCERSGGTLELRFKIATEASPEPALDIITEAETGKYDAVVIGRHGHTGLKRFVLGGTASKVVHHLQQTPVWLVP